MSHERWEEILKVFYAAVEVEPGKRASFLRQASGDDQGLRHEVGSLLEAEALCISPRTVKRDWAVARVWLHREISRGEP